MFQNPISAATLPTLPPEVIKLCGDKVQPHEKPPLVYVPIQKKDAKGIIKEVLQEQKLGRWLRAAFPQMEQNYITYLVETYVKSNADLSSYRTELSTDYVEVYKTPMYYLEKEGESCMTGEDAVQVYEYDDRLRLLCVYNAHDELCARTLVRLDNMQYIRLYIDKNKINPVNLLALVEGSFTKGNLDGIKLAKIEHNYGYVCPYLDGDVQNVDIKDDHLLVCKHGDFSATNISGYIETCYAYCCCCNASLTEDEGCHSEDGDIYCESCYVENVCYCEFEGIEVHPSEAVYISSDNLPQLASHSTGHGEGYYSREWIRDNIMNYL